MVLRCYFGEGESHLYEQYMSRRLKHLILNILKFESKNK